MPDTTRGLPSTSPRRNCGKVFWLTRLDSTSTSAMVEALSASGNAANTASMALGPTSFSRATAFCVAGLAGSVEDRISVISRSARRFEKKLIQPVRRSNSAGMSAASLPGGRTRNGQGAVRARRRDGCRCCLVKESAFAIATDYAIALRPASLGRPLHGSRADALQCLVNTSLEESVNSPAESVNRVRAALEAYVDPYLGEPLGAAQAVEEV